LSRRHPGNRLKPLLDQASYEQRFALQASAAVKPGQRFFWRQDDGGLVSGYFNRETKDGFAVVMNRNRR
jgi:hypothetical protein